MPQNLLAIHGVIGLVVCVGEGGRILHFAGDIYQPVEVKSPTKARLCCRSAPRPICLKSPCPASKLGPLPQNPGPALAF
jgi:thiamine pyrophosphokinase